MTRWVYSFGGGGADGDAAMKNLLGGKGANLAEMSALGLPVPPGFTVTTEACVHYYANERNYPADLEAQVAEGLAKLGFDLEKSAVRMPTGPLKMIGESELEVSLHTDVVATVKVVIVGEQ